MKDSEFLDLTRYSQNKKNNTLRLTVKFKYFDFTVDFLVFLGAV